MKYFPFVEWANMSNKHMVRLGTKHSNIGENLFTATLLFFLSKSPEYIRAIFQHGEQRSKFCNPKILYIFRMKVLSGFRKTFASTPVYFEVVANTICTYSLKHLSRHAIHSCQTISTISFHIYSASKRLLYQPG